MPAQAIVTCAGMAIFDAPDLPATFCPLPKGLRPCQRNLLKGFAPLPSLVNVWASVGFNDFQRERGFDVMLLSPKAGGVGLTLTAANHVVHLSRRWNPAVEDQCSDRVYRIGRTRPVHIYYPLAVLPDAQEYSFDVQLLQLMARKRKLAQDLLAPPAFTTEDYKALIAGTLRAKA